MWHGDAKESTSIEGVDVYFNLHKRVWSCRSRKTGLVIAHSPVVIAAQGAGLIVREAGRLRVIKEKRKNVHAFARLDYGTTSTDLPDWEAFCKTLKTSFEVSYNPYRAGHFTARIPARRCTTLQA
jgi:hypothetical protein